MRGRPSERTDVYRLGKVDVVKKEAVSHNRTLLGITETHMRGQGHFKTSNSNILYFLGPTNSSTNGVANWISHRLNKYVQEYNPVSDRIMTMRLHTRPRILNIVVVFAPTANSTEDMCDNFYATIEMTLSKIPSREITLILGDWNPKVGDITNDDYIRSTVCRHGLGVRNDTQDSSNSALVTNSQY